MIKHSDYIQRAIELAKGNVENGGGPFGSLVVRNGKIIAESGNQVTLLNDPTAHAEILAIRKAAADLNTFDLSDCILYASCEPCPMCLGAIYWSRIPVVYYASDRHAAQAAGFDDNMIYEDLTKPIGNRKVKMLRIDNPESEVVFRKWMEDPDKTKY